MGDRLWRLTRCMAAVFRGGTGALQPQRRRRAARRALPALGANIDETSVSGISSGAYMAGQFQMAHAKIVTGAAIIAGGPYGCSESVFADTMPGPGTAFLNLSKAVNGCMLDLLSVWGVADPADLAEQGQATRANEGEIDPIADVVERSRLSVLRHLRPHGRAGDRQARGGVLRRARRARGEHQARDDAAGRSCVRHRERRRRRANSIGRALCRRLRLRSGRRTSEAHLRPVAAARRDARAAISIEFDQRAFTQDAMPNGMADHGVVYMPKACRDERRLPRPRRVSRLRAKPRRKSATRSSRRPASRAGPTPIS